MINKYCDIDSIIYNNLEYDKDILEKIHIKKCFNKLNYNIQKKDTFNNKLKFLCIYNCTKLKINCVDKILLHDYCKKSLNEDICVPIYYVYDRTKDIHLSLLPNIFYLKCNHGCGFNILYDKEYCDIKKVKKTLNLWMLIDYSDLHGELQYHYINRKIFSEKCIGKNLIDYKINCFNGNPIWIDIIGDRNKNVFYNTYDCNLNPLVNLTKEYSNYDIIFDKKCINEMIKISKILSKPFKFVRVDFYFVENKIYLGELTFTPSACNVNFCNEKLDLKYGNILNIV